MRRPPLFGGGGGDGFVVVVGGGADGGTGDGPLFDAGQCWMGCGGPVGVVGKSSGWQWALVAHVVCLKQHIEL